MTTFAGALRTWIQMPPAMHTARTHLMISMEWAKHNPLAPFLKGPIISKTLRLPPLNRSVAQAVEGVPGHIRNEERAGRSRNILPEGVCSLQCEGLLQSER